MSLLVKKLFLSAIFNSFLFLALFVGIQNSSNKSKVDFLIDETIELPISFVVEQGSLVFKNKVVIQKDLVVVVRVVARSVEQHKLQRVSAKFSRLSR